MELGAQRGADGPVARRAHLVRAVAVEDLKERLRLLAAGLCAEAVRRVHVEPDLAQLLCVELLQSGRRLQPHRVHEALLFQHAHLLGDGAGAGPGAGAGSRARGWPSGLVLCPRPGPELPFPHTPHTLPRAGKAHLHLDLAGRAALVAPGERQYPEGHVGELRLHVVRQDELARLLALLLLRPARQLELRRHRPLYAPRPDGFAHPAAARLRLRGARVPPLARVALECKLFSDVLVGGVGPWRALGCDHLRDRIEQRGPPPPLRLRLRLRLAPRRVPRV